MSSPRLTNKGGWQRLLPSSLQCWELRTCELVIKHFQSKALSCKTNKNKYWGYGQLGMHSTTPHLKNSFPATTKQGKQEQCGVLSLLTRQENREAMASVGTSFCNDSTGQSPWRGVVESSVGSHKASGRGLPLRNLHTGLGVFSSTRIMAPALSRAPEWKSVGLTPK